MFGMMVNTGLKFLSASTLSRGITLGSRSQDLKFSYMSKFLCLCLYSYTIKTLCGISFIFYMLVDIGLEFYSASSLSWGMTLRSRSPT